MMEVLKGKRELAVIIFKALGVYSFIQALAVFAYRFPILYYKNSLEDDIMIILQVLFLSIMLAIFAFVIWFMSPRIAESLFNNANINKEDVISSTDMHMIAFSFIGMLVVIDGLPEIVKTIFFHYQVRSLPGIEEGMAMVAERNSYLLATILQCGLGVWLILGSRGITNFIRNLRRR